MKKDNFNWEEEFDEKINKTVSNGGFLANVPEDYEPLDFEVEEIKRFISQVESSTRRELMEEIKNEIHKLRRKYVLDEDIREDVKNCKNKDCEHYFLAAEDFSTDLLSSLHKLQK